MLTTTFKHAEHICSRQKPTTQLLLVIGPRLQRKTQTRLKTNLKLTVLNNTCSILSTDCELSTETCSKNVYSLGPWSWLESPSTLMQRSDWTVQLGTLLARQWTIDDDGNYAQYFRWTMHKIMVFEISYSHLGFRLHVILVSNKYWYIRFQSVISL